MYKFNKERALRGDKVINRVGHEVKGLKLIIDPIDEYSIKDEFGRNYNDKGYWICKEHLSHYDLFMAEPDIECNKEEATKDYILTPKIEIVEIPQDDSEVFYIDVWNDEGQMALSWTNERQLEEPGYKKIGMLKLTLNRKDFIKE